MGILIKDKLSRALRRLIGLNCRIENESDAAHLIRLVLILKICNFRVGAKLNAVLREVAHKLADENTFIPMTFLFKADGKTIVNVDTRAMLNNQYAYPVTLCNEEVGKCMGEFIRRVSMSLDMVPDSPKHAFILLDLEKITKPRLFARAFHGFISPMVRVGGYQAFDEGFVHSVRVMLHDYAFSTPRLGTNVCDIPVERQSNRAQALAIVGAAVFVTYFLLN